jgi:hypothetical protein
MLTSGIRSGQVKCHVREGLIYVWYTADATTDLADIE